MEPNERRKAIGKNLQRLRKEAGFRSAKSFAESAGLNPGTYTSYEQGERSFTYETAWDMADALHCTLDELGGRSFDARKFSDPRQEKMNRAFDSLSDASKTEISNVAQSYALDPSRRIEKNKSEDVSAEEAMG